MSWDVLIQLVISAGLSVAEEIARRKKENDLVTDEDWAALRAASKRDAQSRMAESLARHNIGLDDPRAQAFLALAQ